MEFELREEYIRKDDVVTEVKEKCIARFTDAQIKPLFHGMKVNERRNVKGNPDHPIDDAYILSVVRTK